MRAVSAGLVVVAFALLGTAAAFSYNEDMARTFVHLAGAAYCPEDRIWGWNGTVHSVAVPGFQTEAVLFDGSSDTQAYVGYLPSADAVVVSYRGTVGSSLRNWIEDLEAWRTKTSFPGCDNCKVHDGFWKDYLALQPAIHPALDAALSRHSGANLWVTGHSLGAAMACLLAADLASAGHDIGTVYTFGQPRVGDAAFASYYGSQVADEYYRVVHYHDIVPHVPPELLGFRHVPTEVWYSTETGDNYKVCDGTGEDGSCSDSVTLPISVSDHLKYLGSACARRAVVGCFRC